MTSYKEPTKSISIPNTSSDICTYKSKTVTLGNYKIQKKSIGKGSFSKIYVGTSISTGEQIAVKIIKKSNVKNENVILREIKIMSMIKHQNVLCLLDVLVSNNKYYLIMEYCDMGDLKEYMKCRNLDETELKYYVKQIRDGMWELHTNNIIHRDLKPQNILVTADDTLKISDFGFAKSYNPDTDLQQTMCGSPLYMAPEILEQKRYTDAVDLWSIGVIMYELFFNKVPVKGKNIVDLIKNVRRFKLKIPKTNKKCSSNCFELIKMLLKTNPNERCSWEEFYNNNWFNKSFKNNLNFTNDNDNDNDNGNENENDPNIFMFEMDEDENVLYRSNVEITNNYLEKQQNKLNVSHSYIEDEYFDDNYVIITSPSEMDIYSQHQVKSFNTNGIEDINQTETQSIKYVRMKRIFNSLKDSISYMFRAKSV